ncbi:MAG TPA: DsrE family protein [Cyclobacteriaceae bacterium]
MKKTSLLSLLVVAFIGVNAQQLPPKVNPVIKDFGGIFEIPYADEKPDPSLTYNVIIEVQQESDKGDTLNWALNNVARMLNIHAMAGVSTSKMNVVLAIHGGATYAIMNNEAYKTKYKVDNPNLKLIDQLSKAGVKMFVCGQSIVNRKVDRMKLAPPIKVASSALTTLTNYQLKGYALLKF